MKFTYILYSSSLLKLFSYIINRHAAIPPKIFSMIDNTIILRVAVAITLLAHSVPAILNNWVSDFGTLYLNEVGFAPFGLWIAWAIKISHVICAILLILNRYVKVASFLTIFILIAGIIMLHAKEGWFVVGAGRNGMEFNFLLICILLSIVFQNRIKYSTAKGINHSRAIH